ncbi:MAG: sulfatase-like hydrolase/transferase [Deltaproteobacteria bacterium]|nr:sulfatase-like hydrolase/transferase [Deltaproteobacteria bacterium]
MKVGVGSCLGALTALALCFSSAAQARDNFIIVLADDLGVDKIGVYSRDDLYGHPGEGASPGPTPVIDQLAREGILFRNAYANPVCSPTRAATLTGRHGFRTGIGTPANAELPLSEMILPEILGATHRTAAIGKWHLGRQLEDHPNDSGFSRFIGTLTNIDDYFSWPKTTDGVTVQGRNVYATTDNVNDAISVVSGFGEDPWFVWLAFNAPHTPFHAPPQELHTFQLSGNPVNTAVDHYEAAVQALDTELGRLLDSIPGEVLADTTIIFVGDNGSPRRSVEAPFDGQRAKGTVYEGGTNVPFIVVSPHIPATRRGEESLALVHVVDIHATVAEIAGVSSQGEDSVSLLPYLSDPTRSTLPVRPYVYSEQFSPNGEGPFNVEERGIRDERYKLIWREGDYEEFFDLEEDPFEDDNLLGGALSAAEQASFDALVASVDRLRNGGEVCVTGAESLCLQGDRFRVDIEWQTPAGDSGSGQAVPLTSDTGYFWFFSQANVEMVIKVLNGCSANDHFWVFAGGLTNVQVDITVTDTATGQIRTYQNPLRTPFQPIQDTAAFGSCP